VSENPTRTRLFSLVLITAALYLTWLEVRPFAEVIFLAAVVAAALHPLATRLARLLRGRKNLASAIVTVGLLLLGIGPLLFVAGVLVNQGIQGYDWVSQTLRSEGMVGLLSRLPVAVQGPVDAALQQVPKTSTDILTLAKSQGGTVTAVVTGALSLTGRVLFQFAIFLLAFFFLLTDGPDLVARIRRALPLTSGQFDLFLHEFKQVTTATLLSTVATAGIQSVIALVGYLLTGVPQPLFFFLVTFLMALVPALGATSVVLALAALKLATGHAAAAGVLVVWGIVFVAMSDNLVKPLLMKSSVQMHGGVLLLSLLGGLLAFGPIGILAGPLVVVFLLAVVRMVQAEREGGGSGADPVDTQAHAPHPRAKKRDPKA
jgi:predicted PurR-regulated permease PerM